MKHRFAIGNEGIPGLNDADAEPQELHRKESKPCHFRGPGPDHDDSAEEANSAVWAGTQWIFSTSMFYECFSWPQKVSC